MAASPSAFVSGAAAAIVVSAVVRALARTSELTTFLADMVFSKLGLRRPIGEEHRSIRLFVGGYYHSEGSQIREAAGNLSVRRPEEIQPKRAKTIGTLGIQSIAG